MILDLTKKRRATRFVLHRYHNTSSVSAMLTQLGGVTLQVRRAKVRWVLLYKATRQIIVLDTLPYLAPLTQSTRQNHDLTFRHYRKFS